MDPLPPRIRLFAVFAVFAVVMVLTTACQGGSGPTTEPSSPQPAASSYFTEPFPIAVKYDQPGFGANSGTDYEGFDISLAGQLGKAFGLTPAFVRVDDTSRETSLANRSVKLVIASYSITQLREQGHDGVPPVDFAGPYLQSPEGLLVRRGGPFDSADPNLGQARVCTIGGSTADDVQLPDMKDKITKVTYSDCLDLLERGRVDAVFTDWLVLYGYVQARLPQYTNLDVVSTHLGVNNEYGIALPAGMRGPCLQIAGFLAGYVGTSQWATDLEVNFNDIAKNYPGARSTQTDWRNPFRPTSSNDYAAWCK